MKPSGTTSERQPLDALRYAMSIGISRPILILANSLTLGSSFVSNRIGKAIPGFFRNRVRVVRRTITR